MRKEWLRQTMEVARKEFRAYFTTPAAYLFLGAFLAVTLFVFFWVETFFARNIADARPLFEWLPLLLVLLVAALTMRSWSEERRAGTIESLMTSPTPPWQLVLGKFAAVMALVALALLLTLPLPVTADILGPLDWGPVVGGYVATLFLAAAYTAIGLYMSGRTDNPVVSLILTSAACGALYFIGSPLVTTLFGDTVGAWLAGIGTGSRFESIARGVLDLRDIYYYVSLVGVFLALNLYTLERLRRAGNPAGDAQRRAAWMLGLTVANLLVANLWLAQVPRARVDLTAGNVYSLSEATRSEIAALPEPVTLRGYFSARTHPLLAPLVPRLKDLLREYETISGGRVRVEIVDPTRNSEAEEQAASRYGVQPVPFQTADRYEAAVVSSYFDVVASCGDEFEKLGFRDLIEVKGRGEGELDVVLKDPEYAITRAIRRAAAAFRAGGTTFASLEKPVTFHGYFSPDERLPEVLRNLRQDVDAVLGEWRGKAGDKLKVSIEDPDANGGRLGRELGERYGLVPQFASLTDPTPFWFYMLLEGDGELVQVPLPETLDREALKRSMEAALRRFTPGALRTVALVKPSPGMSMGMGGGPTYQQLEAVLGENLKMSPTDLSGGVVPAEADVLLVLAPRDLDEKQRFAIDQFLMRGGSVVLATAPFDVEVAGSINAQKQSSGLEDWLKHYGVTVQESMVLDPQNTALAVPVERFIGGLMFREFRLMPYPHFPDIREDGLAGDSPVTSSLGQLTFAWASPIEVDAERNAGRKVTTLLRSSRQSWVSDSTNVLPDYGRYPDTGFEPRGDRGPRTLAVSLEGRFDSFYAGKPSPLGDDGASRGVLSQSPDTAKLVVIGSNGFGSDAAINLVSQSLNVFYTKPLDFLQNTIDWALEDPGLMTLRGRTQLARTLDPLDDRERRFWEIGNYAAAVFGLVIVWLWRRRVRSADQLRYARVLGEV
ncbi:MAG: Gldg family protein [Pseudomonadota bacterium]|jgi:ABC-2 type transport system permease protein